jgi:hypothetical protein
MNKRSLQIDEDIAFQHREWMAQRVGIALLFLFVLGALFGLTGVSGPFTRGEISDPAGVVRVEYDRIVRRGARANLTLHVRSPAPGDLQFWISAPYVRDVTIEKILPEPDTEVVETERHVYALRAGPRDVTVAFEVDHTTIGPVHGEIGIVGGPTVRFTQWSLF